MEDKNNSPNYELEKFLTGLTLNLDYKQKLYFQANESLNSTIKFIAGFYGAFLTIIIALLNFSDMGAMEFSKMVYYCSFMILFALFVNSIGKSLILEALNQYLVKEILFKEMDNLKNTLDNEYGLIPDENTIYSKKNFRVVQELYLTFLWFNSWLCAVSAIATLSIILALFFKLIPESNSSFYYGFSTIFLIISTLGSYYIYKNVNRNGNECFEIEKRIWNNGQITSDEKRLLKKDRKTAKKVIISFIALILLGIYLKLKF
mgnify:CR=1 FL=1